MFEQIALSWPDRLSEPKIPLRSTDSLLHLAAAIRRGHDPLRVEAALQSRAVEFPETAQDASVLLAWLSYTTSNRARFFSLLDSLRMHAASRLEVRVLTLLGWLWVDNRHALLSAPTSIWRGEDSSVLLQLCRVACSLKLGDQTRAERQLECIAEPLPLEALLLKARILSQNNQKEAAVALLLPLLIRAPNHLRLYRDLLNHLIDARDGQHVMGVARAALAAFGEHPELLYHFTTLNLYQRHPGLARRSALMQQVSASVRITPINVGNQVNTYEVNGNCNWLEYLNYSVSPMSIRDNSQLHSNLAMQLASIQSARYSGHVGSVVSGLSGMHECRVCRDLAGGPPSSRLNAGSSLRIAWITGDLSYHPVSRFLYGQFVAGRRSFSHQHTLVSLIDHGAQSSVLSFSGIEGVEVLDVSSLQNNDRIAAIRGRQFDLAVDLSGWTGGNYLAGFLARLAPVQVNYLGYFASVGLPTMDYWLGDQALFPQGHREWATETLWRLPRPFLAWQPVDPLPEAAIGVTAAPLGPVRFGSFNHNRKLSDATLRLWSELIEAVPGSRLVLKASADSDADTQRLLQRRMRRQGLDIERVEWLALTKGPVEHMQQYARIDIALDPIPNGGCTTTCEALWLGVPTITMAGTHYVSRMSTAVLAGAGMPEWIADDRAGYLALAREHAARVQELRQNREQWRHRLQASPLGDAADLMRHLEDAFSAMHVERLSKT